MLRRRQHALLVLRRISTANVCPAAWAGGASYHGSALEDRKGKAAPLQARGMVDRFRLRARGGDGGNGCVSQSSQGRTAKAGLTLAMEEQLVMSFLSALGRSRISVACSITRKLAEEAMDFLRIR